MGGIGFPYMGGQKKHKDKIQYDKTCLQSMTTPLECFYYHIVLI